MSETREQAIEKLHSDLAHEGEPKGCVRCQNLATTLGWDDSPPFTYPHTQDLPNCRATGCFPSMKSNLRSLEEKAKDETSAFEQEYPF